MAVYPYIGKSTVTSSFHPAEFQFLDPVGSGNPVHDIWICDVYVIQKYIWRSNDTEEYDMKNRFALILYVNSQRGGLTETGKGTRENPFININSIWSVANQYTGNMNVIAVVSGFIDYRIAGYNLAHPEHLYIDFSATTFDFSEYSFGDVQYALVVPAVIYGANINITGTVVKTWGNRKTLVFSKVYGIISSHITATFSISATDYVEYYVILFQYLPQNIINSTFTINFSVTESIVNTEEPWYQYDGRSDGWADAVAVFSEKNDTTCRFSDVEINVNATARLTGSAAPPNYYLYTGAVAVASGCLAADFACFRNTAIHLSATTIFPGTIGYKLKQTDAIGTSGSYADLVKRMVNCDFDPRTKEKEINEHS